MIKKYTTKNGETRYLFQTYLGIDPLTGKERRTTRRGFKTMKEAKQAERNLLLDVEENGFCSVSEKQTFEAVARLWLESYQTTVKPTTYQNTKSYLDILIKDYFNNILIENLTVLRLQKITIELSKRYLNYTIHLSVINRVLKYAVLLDIIKANPLDKVIRPKQQEKREKKKFFTKKELTVFLDLAKKYASPVLFVAWWTLAYTGLRRGELLALKWSDIDFENRTLRVERTLVRISGQLSTQSPKTKKSRRMITLDPRTIEILKNWRLKQKKILFKNGAGKSELVFSNSSGGYLMESRLRDDLRKFLRKHGLPIITVHGFRHTHASILFEAGIEAKQIADRLGHSRIQTTLDMYTHINDSQRYAVADRLLDFLEA
nr:MAG TPA: RECOMBINASE CRE [Caudoviricetes sp.]